MLFRPILSFFGKFYINKWNCKSRTLSVSKNHWSIKFKSTVIVSSCNANCLSLKFYNIYRVSHQYNHRYYCTYRLDSKIVFICLSWGICWKNLILPKLLFAPKVDLFTFDVFMFYWILQQTNIKKYRNSSCMELGKPSFLANSYLPQKWNFYL